MAVTAFASVARLAPPDHAGRPRIADLDAFLADEYVPSSEEKLSFYKRLADTREEAEIDELFDERQGVYHYWDGSYHLAGLLSDQAYVLRALVDSFGGLRRAGRAWAVVGVTLAVGAGLAAPKGIPALLLVTDFPLPAPRRRRHRARRGNLQGVARRRRTG